MNTQEEIADIGYLAPECKHVLITVRNPTLLSDCTFNRLGKEFAQIALTIENAQELHRQLGEFLWPTYDLTLPASQPSPAKADEPSE